MEVRDTLFNKRIIPERYWKIAYGEMYSVYSNAIHGRIIVETIWGQTISDWDDNYNIFLRFKKELDDHQTFLFRLELYLGSRYSMMQRHQYFFDLATLETIPERPSDSVNSRIITTSNFLIESQPYDTLLTIENNIGESYKIDTGLKV